MVENARKLRSDSVVAHVTMAKDARKADARFSWPLTWQLPEDEAKRNLVLLTCDDIFACRPVTEWSALELSLIAEIALITTDLAEIQQTLSAAGYLTHREGKGGREVATRHPLLDVAQHLSTRRTSLARSMSLTGSATNPRGAGARAQVFNLIADGLDVSEDNLLAQ